MLRLLLGLSGSDQSSSDLFWNVEATAGADGAEDRIRMLSVHGHVCLLPKDFHSTIGTEGW